jgi:hypothetical protein
MKKIKQKTLKELSGLTPKEREFYSKDFDEEIKRLRLVSKLGEDELSSIEMLDDWKISMDKMMIKKMVKKLHGTIKNYKRKIFGYSTIAPDTMVAYFITEMMKELIVVRYTDRRAFEKFFGHIKDDEN